MISPNKSIDLIIEELFMSEVFRDFMRKNRLEATTSKLYEGDADITLIAIGRANRRLKPTEKELFSAPIEKDDLCGVHGVFKDILISLIRELECELYNSKNHLLLVKNEKGESNEGPCTTRNAETPNAETPDDTPTAA